MCSCHDIVLTALQQKSLVLLRAWVTQHGTKNMCDRLISGPPDGQAVYNRCNYHFSNVTISGSERLSNLAKACHLADIPYTPGMLRSTTIDEDLAEVIQLYDAGAPLFEVAMKKTQHSRLFSRLKKRMRNWFAVFTALRKLRSDIEFRRFFSHAPVGVYVDLDDSVSVLHSSEEVIAYAERLFAAYVSTTNNEGNLVVMLGEAPKEVRTLYTRLTDQGLDAKAVFEKASGRVFKGLSHLRGGYVPNHLLAGKEHPSVRSYSELLVDNVLSGLIPNYTQRHRHDVMLKELVPDAPWADSPYIKENARSPTVDIVVDNKLIFEVSFMTERISPRYRSRMLWKVETLNTSGFHAVNVKIENKAAVNAQLVCDALKSIGVECDAEKARDLFWEHEPVRVRPPDKRVPPTPEERAQIHLERQQAKTRTRPKQTKAEQARTLAAQGWSERGIADTLGMQLFNVHQALTKAVGRRVDWDNEPDLGKVPDKTLAARHGVDPSTVVSARQKRGLPAFRTLKSINLQ